MIVYVETNFLFEHGLGRAQQESCRTLLQWCQQRHVDLRIPAFSIPEVHSALRRRERARFDVVRGLKSQQSDARRHSADPSPYAVAEDGLHAWTKREGSRMAALMLEMDLAATFLPLDFNALQTAIHLHEVKAVGGDADRFILATIICDLDNRKRARDTAPSLFITGDTDFSKATSYLTPYSCSLVTSYSAAVARLKGPSA